MGREARYVDPQTGRQISGPEFHHRGNAFGLDKVFPQDLKKGETVTLEINGQMVVCEYVDFVRLVKAGEFNLNNPNLVVYQKNQCTVTFVDNKFYTEMSGEEESDGQGSYKILETKQDGTKEKVRVDSVLIKNPGDVDPYVFVNEGETVADARERFNRTYTKNQDDTWTKTDLIVAILVDRATAIVTGWDSNLLMGTPAGGVITVGGYTITADSLRADYQKVENITPEISSKIVEQINKAKAKMENSTFAAA